MTKTAVESYRRQLIAMKKRLGAALSDLEEEALRGIGGEASGGISNVPIHPADLGTDNFEEQITLGLLENEDQILTEIDDALERIDNGTFGRCENCGKEISRERLDALPYARYCVACARKIAKETKR
jgi:DnaK suppressor protein